MAFHYLTQTVMGGEHLAIHDGRAWQVDHYEAGIANSGAHNVIITPTIYPLHFRWNVIASDAPCTVQMFRGPSYSGGDAATIISLKDFDGSDTTKPAQANSTETVVEGATVTDNGTQLDLFHMFAVSTGFFSGAGAVRSSSLGDEILTRSNVPYMLLLTNNSGGAINIQWKIFWYWYPRLRP